MFVACVVLTVGLAQRQMAEEWTQVTLCSWQPLSLAGSLEKIWPWQKEESQLLHPDNMTEMQVLNADAIKSSVVWNLAVARQHHLAWRILIQLRVFLHRGRICSTK